MCPKVRAKSYSTISNLLKSSYFLHDVHITGNCRCPASHHDMFVCILEPATTETTYATSGKQARCYSSNNGKVQV